MPCSGVIGSVSEKRVQVDFEWTIPDFSSLTAGTNHYFDSPAFSVSGCSWHLRLYPNGCNVSGYISLYLRMADSEITEKNMTFTLGIRTSQYSLEEVETSTQTFGGNLLSCGRKTFYNRNNIPDPLILTCSVKDNVPPSVEAIPPPMKLVELETLSSNLRDLYTSRIKFDVTVRVKNMEFRVHKAVLMVRSRVFAAMFEHDMSEEETGILTIEDCDPDSFGDFLHYLYAGKLENVSSRNAYHLYVTADKYDVQELKAFCVAYMMHNLTAENVCDVVTLADRYGDTGLLSSAQIFFNRNVSRILSTVEWETLMKENYRLANRLFKEMASNVKTH